MDGLIRTGSRRMLSGTSDMNICTPLVNLNPGLTGSKTLAAKSRDTYAVTNDHYVGKAAVNALEMASLVKVEPAKAPRCLVEHCPALGILPFLADQVAPMEPSLTFAQAKRTVAVSVHAACYCLAIICT